MATAPPQPSLHMRSTDLIIKEPLDYGGFGEVYLCYHVTLGQVVLKTMYTGLIRNEDRKRSLLEEGNIMASLNHERVVKLLGVIMEDRDCSLVMELIPRGNLLVMLETVSVPISIKGRIILEILEGMMYLTEKHVIHKDIKPENILVDKDFHIKIADLGLATCQTWSKLTKEESRRKSHVGRSSGTRGAGTLSYMAPEHLESVHAASTEKSDVYSFAIVVWVILTGEEPYANARSEDQISQCVRNGNRPLESLIPEDTPAEIIKLMKSCWDPNPQQRPTFKEAYDFFLPFYMEKLHPNVEKDLTDLKIRYEGPEELVEKMKSLSLTHESFLADCPAPLVSSDRSVSVPVEASIEDLHDIQYEAPVESQIQTDARPGGPSALEEKLDRELQYHKYGSYNCENQLESASGYPNSSNPYMQNQLSSSECGIRQPEQEKSSVQSWTKAEPVHPTSQEETWYRPTTGLYESMTSYAPTPSSLPTSISTPSLSQLNQQHPHSHFDRQQSWPVYPVCDSYAPDMTTGRLLNSSKSGSAQDPGSLYIQNASGIQIGNNNLLSIRGYESSQGLSFTTNGLANSLIKEAIQKYEDHAVTEEHLDLLRENIGANWKSCARRLGLSTVEIETIELDSYRYGLPEMVHQMLERWKMKEGSIGCTIGKLCRALVGKIKVDIIQKILDSCETSP
ncbi:receptor-interacting serine/threonine-protein kinase 1 isoform X1 [Sphaeramia orbicularis]|uniref:Receptor (TNFRSF)-interacting serine-threonine kinase 1, like n=1 Tax=Sphaeramia orbicularis TaxID=375764 RepID=A0A672YMD2_9TELE|nr:receptor-interacting serine/threonine-protein kinase 1 isoform X1 [Sphaeramia orbicularis]XP_030017292.1 receptor-interacting serine/threonine-protein kinase 1 isoform X1 [Sphaeramia orbicularis]XP_030017293.1 receptor-interacting serine/threonine-protein kinase 1 isoform X1 [Sphaeramia orbicularis]